MRIGIIHVGAPAGGMNAATRVAARICLNRVHTALGIRNGFSGLLRDEVVVLKWEELIGWQSKGVKFWILNIRGASLELIEIIQNRCQTVLLLI